MAVKCDIPNLALKSLHSLLYGFNCEDVTAKIVQNYIEYLNCPGVDKNFCRSFPCEEIGNEVFCSIADVNFIISTITTTTAVISFTPPSQPYIIELIKVEDDSIIDTKQSPISPISYTGLIPETNYNVRLILLCEGGEIKVVNFPIFTVPICVEIIDYTAETEDVNEYE